MTYLSSWRERINRAFSDDANSSHELATLVTYLACLAPSGADRLTLLAHAARQPLAVARPLQQALNLTDDLGFDHVGALQLVADVAYPPATAGSLRRFAGAIAAGVPEAEYFSQEQAEMTAEHGQRYARALTSLEQWMSAYSVTIISSIMLVVVLMVTSLIFTPPPQALPAMGAAMMALLVVGLHALARAVPAESAVLDTDDLPLLRRARRLLVVLLPAGVAVGAWFGRGGNLAGLFLSIGLALLPSGLLAGAAERRAEAAEGAVASFVRKLGTLAGTLQATAAAALQQMAPEAMGPLAGTGQRLKRRLRLHLDPQVSWQLFATETGSELVLRTTTAFRDALYLGTPPGVAGKICGEYAEQIHTLRSRRRSTTSHFTGLVLTLHGIMTAVFLLILSAVSFFSGQLGIVLGQIRTGLANNPMGYIPALWLPGSVNTAQDSLVTYLLLTALTVANGLAPRWVRGGHWLTTCLHLGITLTMTGALMLIIPHLVGLVFTYSAATLGP